MVKVGDVRLPVNLDRKIDPDVTVAIIPSVPAALHRTIRPDDWPVFGASAPPMIASTRCAPNALPVSAITARDPSSPPVTEYELLTIWPDVPCTVQPLPTAPLARLKSSYLTCVFH